MITRLEVDGFKSLRDFAIDLDPFTVLIGPNSAGKSNILEALALLSRLATHPIAEAFKKGRGRPSDQFTREGNESARAVRFAVEFFQQSLRVSLSGRSPGPRRRFRYELTLERQTLSSGAERLVVREERLCALRVEGDDWLAAHPEFPKPETSEDPGKELFTATWRSGGSITTTDGRVIALATTHTSLAQVPISEVFACRINLGMIRSLRLDGAQLGESSDRIDSDGLSADGSNLPTILAGLSPTVLGEIRADLVRLVPGIASFEVVPDDDELRLDFKLSGGERMPARLVSDGTLRILVLLTALRLEPRRQLLTIEEPENGIYPGRLRALLSLMQDETARRHDHPDGIEALGDSLREFGGASSLHIPMLPTQILVTTHSPVLLSALRKQPQHLRFVDTVRRDGRPITRVRTVGRPTTPAEGRFKISPREIEQLLDSTRDEETE
jgi:predicted ATPase